MADINQRVVCVHLPTISSDPLSANGSDNKSTISLIIDWQTIYSIKVLLINPFYAKICAECESSVGRSSSAITVSLTHNSSTRNDHTILSSNYQKSYQIME